MSDVSVDAGRDKLFRILPFKHRRLVRRRNSLARAPQKDDTPDNEECRYHEYQPRDDLLRGDWGREPVWGIDDDQCEDRLEREESWKSMGPGVRKRCPRYPDDRNRTYDENNDGNHRPTTVFSCSHCSMLDPDAIFSLLHFNATGWVESVKLILPQINR